LPADAAWRRIEVIPMMGDGRIRVFSTCPPFDPGLPDYGARVAEVSRWSEGQGCRGALVYTDNSMLDPWLVAQLMIEQTRELRPLVAVQPVYTHPYTVAKAVTTLGTLHGRAVDINWVAGGFTRDLQALGEATPHDERYERLVEYAGVVVRLLGSEAPLTLEGRYHRVQGLSLTPPLPGGLQPGHFVSGSSEAGRAAARALGAVAVEYPPAVPEDLAAFDPDSGERGMRVGVLAREDVGVAGSVAYARFPPDRQGRLMHRLAMAASDSSWHKQLVGHSAREDRPETPYWMIPFENYKTFCPYLVGSHERVAQVLAHHLRCGYTWFILDVPFVQEDLEHAGRAFALAAREAWAPTEAERGA